MAQKVETKVDLPTSDVLDAYSDSFEAQRPDIEEPDEDVDKAKDSGVGLVSLYQRVVAPPIQPLWVEREVQFAINGQPYSGVIDLVQERTSVFGTEHIIRDTKTTARTPSGEGYAIAMTGYSVAYRQEMGSVEHDVVLDYLIRTKVPKYLPISNQGPVSDDAVAEFGTIVSGVSAAINAGLESGDFVPNGLNNNACSWCGYSNICPAYQRFHK
jgi:hypothetical protein